MGASSVREGASALQKKCSSARSHQSAPQHPHDRAHTCCAASVYACDTTLHPPRQFEVALVLGLSCDEGLLA